MIDPDNPPLGEPLRVVAGSTYKWRRNLPNFLPADSWVLSYGFSNGEQQDSLTATNYGDGTHLATLTLTATGDWDPGDWEWRAYVTKSGERYDVGRGVFPVEADIASEAKDIRSNVKRVLDAINAMLEGKATNDQQSMSIAGRSLSRMSWDELMRARRTYKRLHRDEIAAARRNMGLSGGTRLKVRFPQK